MAEDVESFQGPELLLINKADDSCEKSQKSYSKQSSSVSSRLNARLSHASQRGNNFNRQDSASQRSNSFKRQDSVQSARPLIGLMNRVLICNPCPFTIIAIKGLIEQFGLTCDVLSDGQDTKECVRERIRSKKQPYELILVDFDMPRVTGPEICQ